MGRATTKAELISAANTQFNKLNAMIATLTPEQQAAEFRYDAAVLGKEAHWLRDKDLRDVLAHLYEWHRLLLEWLAANLAGNAQPFLPEPYNWKTYGAMNVGFWEKHQQTTLEAVTEMFAESHIEVLKAIENLTDEELFEKKHFNWTGTSNVGSYCVSATASHYDWAMKKLKAYKKTLQLQKK